MISLEQVRRLDIRVRKAVATLKVLSAENAALKQKISELEAGLDELRREASDRKADEERLEVGLQGVLEALDEVDDETAQFEPEPPANDVIVVNSLEESPETEPIPDVESDIQQEAPSTEDEKSDDDVQVSAVGPDEETEEKEADASKEQEDQGTQVEEEIVLKPTDDPSGNDDNDRFQSEFDIF